MRLPPACVFPFLFHLFIFSPAWGNNLPSTPLEDRDPCKDLLEIPWGESLDKLVEIVRPAKMEGEVPGLQYFYRPGWMLRINDFETPATLGFFNGEFALVKAVFNDYPSFFRFRYALFERYGRPNRKLLRSRESYEWESGGSVMTLRYRHETDRGVLVIYSGVHKSAIDRLKGDKKHAGSTTEDQGRATDRYLVDPSLAASAAMRSHAGKAGYPALRKIFK